jgi:hypothetical protein
VNYELIRATEQDGQEMLEIIESRPTQGLFEVFYTRRPNPVTSYLLENKDTDVYVIKDENGRIALQGACVPHSVYIGGEKKSLGYINGIRKRIDFKEKIDWIRMICDAETRVDYDYNYCSILLANKHAQKVFEKRRADMPNLHYVCDYTTFIVAPRKKQIDNGSFTFRKSTIADEKSIVDFLIREGKMYDLFPCFESFDEFYGLSIDDVYILQQNDEIVCACALWEQSDFKQYVVQKYNGFLKLARTFSQKSTLLGRPFPHEGKPLKFPHLTLFLAKNDDAEYYKTMLANIENIITEKYDMFLIGLTKNNAKILLFEKRKTLSFISKIYLISEETQKISGKVHVECGVL